MEILKHRLVDGGVQHLVCWKNSRKLSGPDMIVVHYTAGTSARTAAEFLAKEEVKASAHLVIGRQGGTDTIRSLAALVSLKSVTNDVTINRLFAGYELTGLDNLEEVGGKLYVNSADSLWGVTFNKLTRVGGDLNITSNAVSEILCPRLETVGGA